jgi:hypothetical protein
MHPSILILLLMENFKIEGVPPPGEQLRIINATTQEARIINATTLEERIT